MFRKILLTSILGIVMTIVGAIGEPTTDDLKTVSSKAYVDTAIATKQVKIPAAGQPNVGAGETVMTYTANGDGEIGERGLYNDTSSYDAATDGDKLITASALKDTFTNLPTTGTTKLECANPGTCDLWTIVDQTAYGAGGGSIDLNALIGVEGIGACAKRLNGDGDWSYNNGCITPVENYGDWATVFPYNGGTVQVSGISACGASQTQNGGTFGGIPSGQSVIQEAYETGMASAPTSSPPGVWCYCKLTSPATSIWLTWSGSSRSLCAKNCAVYCGDYMRRATIKLQSNMFGSVTQ